MTEEERNERRRKRAAFMLLPLLLLGAGCCFWSLFTNVALGEAESFIPAPLGSDALANYGKDDIPGRLRSLSISIVEAVIRDRDPEEENVGSRVEDVSDSLKSPVPTVTPKPGDPTGTPTSPPTTTSTPDLSVTGTVTASGSPSPSPFPSRTSTPTEADVPTAGPTSTSGPSPTPSKTPTPSNTPTPTPSNTPTPTPSNTPTPTPSNTPTPCKVIPKVWVHHPADGQIYNPGSQIEGHAHAWDPDNVNPSDCSPTPENDGVGIVEVEFRVKHFGVPEFIWTDLTQRYCAFGGSSPCIEVPVNGGIWPDSTPITGGVYEMYARAKDDEGQWSLWDYTTFTINLPTPTPTPSNTPTATPSNTPTETPVPPTDTPVPTPTDTPVPSCPDFALSGNGDDDNSEVWWDLTNPGPVAAEINRIELTWTGGGNLQRIKLEGSDIWNGSLSNPVDISSGWTGVSRLFDAPFPLTKELRFFFSNTVNNIYTVTVHSSNSCVIADSHDAD